MTFVIREFRREDAAAVALLIPQLTKNIVDPQNLQTRLERLPDIPSCQCYVAEQKGRVVGFGLVAWHLLPSKGWVGMFEEIVVDKPCANQGIATALTKKLSQFAEAMKLVQGKLHTGNPVAQHVYEKLGFVDKEEKLLVKKFY